VPTRWRAWLRAKRRRLVRRLIQAVAVLLLAPVLLTGLYRVVPPPVTPLMLLRSLEGDGADRTWVALEALPRHVPRAMMAGEDNRFCSHWGFDLVELRNAIETWWAGGALRGASTITMQVTRNLFLWPGGGFFRKGLEALWTPAVELLLPKRRIMELYLNLAETGRGLFGIEAAAQHYFGRPAAELTPLQAARIAAILPAPRSRSAADPGSYTAQRARTLTTRMRQIRGLDACLWADGMATRRTPGVTPTLALPHRGGGDG
jgi:monofunctional biosynthetic peptidoglycan transglycosylase